MKVSAVFFFTFFALTLSAQQKIANRSVGTVADSMDIADDADPTNRAQAIHDILHLKGNMLIVRLKTNDRSIDAYEKNGKKELAEKLRNENRERNLKILDAFEREFDFCPVLFMYTSSTKDLLAGKQNVFLNDKLEIDSNIKLSNCDYYFAEYGTVRSNTRVDDYRYKGVKHTAPSSYPASDHCFLISSKDLEQLREPFPFYTLVTLDGYNKGARDLNAGLWRYYQRNSTADKIVTLISKKFKLSELFSSYADFADWMETYDGYIPPKTKEYLRSKARAEKFANK